MPPGLLGRERELAAIDELLDHVDDQGGSLLVRGEAGLGKSALLDEAARRARDFGMTVLRTAGVPSERQMAFAGLHRLLQPDFARIADLPGPQRDALSSAFGLDNEAAPDLFLIALAALDLLAETAANNPLLLLVEDAHWLDAATSEALAFVARRLEAEPIVLLFALRDGYANRLEQARLPELRLRGLDEIDSERLLDSVSAGLAPETRRMLLEVAEGNPLALVELPRAVGAEEVDLPSFMAPLPLTERLERAFSERVSVLPGPTRSLLLVAALDEGGGLDEILAAATAIEGRPVTAGELTPAEAAGLVAVADGVRFRHPLVRAAVYGGALASSRQAAHAALADAHAADPDRGVWHRAASRAGPDDQVASELEAAAARATRRGAPAVSAAALERAAQMTAAPSRRGNLLVRAAETEFELGRSEVAHRLLEQARPLELGRHDRARLTFLLEASADDGWSGPARVASFAEIANEMTSVDEPELALKSLLTAAVGCWWGNPTQETRDLVVAAAERIPVPDDNPALLAVLACADPLKRGALVIDRISRMTPDPTADPSSMHLVGTAATAVLAFDLSLGFLNVAVDGLRVQGRLGLLAQALVSQSWAALHLGKESVAISAADEAARMARETGQARWAWAAQLAQATVLAERGNFDEADALVIEAEAALMPMGAQAMLALVQFARGRRAISHLGYSEGLNQLRRILDPSDVAFHPFVGAWALPDLVDAAAHSGRRDDAAMYLEQLESLATRTASPFLRAMVAFARPLVASDQDAEELFSTALGADLVNLPCYQSRLQLAYGVWLRRRRRVAQSRVPLRAARDSFDALAFHSLAESARSELRASGEASVRRSPDARDRLTPQELQIAQLAAAGLSNREIGEKLYLSHRTVGSHLYRMFPKLGITSRSQLARALNGSALSRG